MSLRRLSLLLALPTVVGISLSACGTEDDAAPGPAGGGGASAGSAGSAGKGGATAGAENEGGSAGEVGPGQGGAGGDDTPGEGGAGGDSGAAGEGGGNGGNGGSTAGGGGTGGGTAGTGGNGGNGGNGGGSCHTDLFTFDTDPAGSMGKYLTPATGPVQSSTVEWSSTEGVAAPGAGKLNATFGALSEQAQLSLYLPANTSFTCTTKLHAKVKLQSATDLSGINGIAFTINSGPYDSTGRYASQFTSTSSWVLDTWYAIELPFATANYQSPANTLPLFTDVRGIGVMVQTKTSGSTTPTPVTLFVDDVWVE